MRKLVAVLLVAGAVVAFAAVGAIGTSAASDRPKVRQVTVPEADRFTPFALTVRAGDIVKWVNTDADAREEQATASSPPKSAVVRPLEDLA